MLTNSWIWQVFVCPNLHNEYIIYAPMFFLNRLFPNAPGWIGCSSWWDVDQISGTQKGSWICCTVYKLFLLWPWGCMFFFSSSILQLTSLLKKKQDFQPKNLARKNICSKQSSYSFWNSKTPQGPLKWAAGSHPFRFCTHHAHVACTFSNSCIHHVRCWPSTLNRRFAPQVIKWFRKFQRGRAFYGASDSFKDPTNR